MVAINSSFYSLRILVSTRIGLVLRQIMLGEMALSIRNNIFYDDKPLAVIQNDGD